MYIIFSIVKIFIFVLNLRKESKFKMNDQYTKHVGYSNTNEAISTYFSNDTATFISRKITELLRPYYPAGVYVPLDKIIYVMNDVYEAYRPSTGDIMTRYVIPSDEDSNYVNEMINQVIQITVNQIKDNLTTDQINSKLSVWTTVLGDFNEHGLRQFSTIKTRHRRPQPMMFNMNY